MKKSKKVFAMNDDYNTAEDLPALEYELSDEGQEKAAAHESLSADLSTQVDEVVQGLSGAKTGGQVYLIDVRQLEPFPDQPFKEYSPERLQELAADIARIGVLSPILARRHGSRLQILAGHNRWTAAKLAGLSHVPVLVLEADDDQAILVLTSTNLRQREMLYPSEKAHAYKMQMDALKRQGQKTGEEGGYNASSYITQQTGDSRMQIHRFVRLTELVPQLLSLLDKGKISMTPAVAMSYLKKENQLYVLELIRNLGAKLTIDRANTLKNLALQQGEAPLDKTAIDQVLLGRPQPKQHSRISIEYKRIQEYLPQGTPPQDVEEIIIRALQAWSGQ